MVISSQIEKESIFLTFLEDLESVGCNVHLVVPDDNSPSPKLVGTTVSFKWLYHCLLQTGDLQDPKRMKMTREAVPLYYSPIQTTLPDEPIPQMLCPGIPPSRMDGLMLLHNSESP